MTRIRVGVIGAGLMGYWHAYTAGRLGASLKAVADVDLGRATALAARYSGAQATVRPEGVLRPDLVDVVHICSPMQTHMELVQLAIDSGIHVLVEKPMTANAEECRALYTAAVRAGILVCPVHQIGFQNGVTQAMDAINRLGPLSRITFDVCSAGATNLAASALDCVVSDILPHPLSMLLRLWPDAHLDAASWCVHHPTAGELMASGVHADALLSVAISMHARPTRFEMVINCQEGTVFLNLFHGFCVIQKGRVSRSRKVIQPFSMATTMLSAATGNLVRRGLNLEPAYPGLKNLVREFYVAVRSAHQAPIPPEHVIAVAAARDAILARMAPAVSHSDRRRPSARN
jgi:predicted dehydrogenase